MSAKAPPQAEEPADNWDDGSDEESNESGTGNVAGDEAQDDDDEKTSEDSDSEGSDESSDDEDVDDGDYGGKILADYRKLLARRVDLVGDYAGNELFLIDGDSLLLRCFADPKLDFEPGFQLLHAAYEVERFLHQLVTRKCNFRIVFFQSNRELCVPPGANEYTAGKFVLARAVIIRHLRINVAASHPDITIDEFPSCDSAEFASYIRHTSPYFVMMHDGATAADRKGKHVVETENQTPPKSRLALREMIINFIHKGYNVALVNGLEWRDTKVMTMVLERMRRSDPTKVRPSRLLPESSRAEVDASDEFKKLQDLDVQLSEKQRLAVVSLAKLSQKPGAQLSKDDIAKMASAFLVHQAFLAHLPLSSRRLDLSDASDDAQSFLNALCPIAEGILGSKQWQLQTSAPSDINDFVDGRLFLQAVAGKARPEGKVMETYKALSAVLSKISGVSQVAPNADDSDHAAANGSINGEQNGRSLTVLPFSSPVFDKHLKSVNLKEDERAGYAQSAASHRIYQELTHWHNAKKPLVPKAAQQELSVRQKKFADRRDKRFMDEMQKYAASLTNAVGRSLEPETVIVGVPKAPSKAFREVTNVDDSDSAESTASSAKGKTQPKKGGGGKNASKNAGKQLMLQKIAADKAKKDEVTGDKVISAWTTSCRNFESDSDPRSKYRRAKNYSSTLKSDWAEMFGSEVELYMLHALLQHWIALCQGKNKDQHIELTALIWHHARNIARTRSVTKEIMSAVDLTVTTLGLPPIPPRSVEGLPQRKLAFTFALPSKVDALSVGLSNRDYQLLYCGPYLDRNFDSAPDSRVDFHPDSWQRKVLDGIDANQSVFAVAPTSAGKTFISFYAMRKVLEADDESVLVYVAPTKALVNQIAAEIQARYSKKFKYGGKSVWAIHTRDYRINNPTGCQVLVTVPHVLQIMLLAPTNANAWSSRVKRIIFDEVHSIGQAEDGVVWEQLLLLAPCPIIALSATVGNPDEFSDWLGTTQKAVGVDLVTVQHPHRYSDLRKYFYVPPERFAFQGLPEKTSFGVLSLENATGFNHIHPVAALVDKSRGIPADLALEPRDCFELWTAMRKVQTKDYPVSDELDPKKALPEVSRKIDILNWEKSLKALLQEWLINDDSPYEKLLTELESSFRDAEREGLQATRPSESQSKGVTVHEDLTQTTLPLLCRLQQVDALPAIFFNYDRHMCEHVCHTLLDQLVSAEETQEKSGPKWARKLERWEEWKKVQTKTASKKPKAPAKKAKGGDKEDDEKTSKLDQQRDAGGADVSAWESFDPAAPAEGYHFADYTRAQLSEIELYMRQLQRRDVPQWLIDAIQRGIGVHHAGMNRKYRQVVEILFRKGFLRVIIATGTLALGINMPCRTVVFSGDSVFLTALNFRQCAGRAGRRGFDLLGNVVFQDVSREKVCRLISSRLPSLQGHFPLTSTLVLRLFTLLHESKNSKYAVTAINSLLEQPRIMLGAPSFKDQVMHHLRFSIEYLRRQSLLGPNGAPLNFAGLVSHLYFTENSSFAFHALMKEGYFHELCSNINKSEKDTIEKLMLVMAHLFNRIQCRQADEEYRQRVVKPSSSMVFLPPLPEKAAKILLQHNQQTLDIYRAYVETFVDQHISTEDNVMPLSGMSISAEDDEGTQGIQSLSGTHIRSAFVALSGAGDSFDNITDLCERSRAGVYLEEAVVPHIGVFPQELDVPLNAWLLDFFKHGDVHTIEKANGIRRSDIWFLLNDFSLVLSTIIASLQNFMKLREGTDMDMLDVLGDLDVHEEADEDKVADSEEQSEVSGPSVADSAISLPDRPKGPVLKKKAKNLDSWEEAADAETAAEEADAARAEASAALAKELEDPDVRAWEGEEKGLKNVLKAFTKLHAEFSVKFRAMWA